MAASSTCCDFVTSAGTKCITRVKFDTTQIHHGSQTTSEVNPEEIKGKLEYLIAILIRLTEIVDEYVTLHTYVESH